jgi:hypothetical protein
MAQLDRVEVVKLRRGFGSCLLGDAAFGRMAGSPFLTFCTFGILNPIGGLDWLPLLTLASLALLSIS